MAEGTADPFGYRCGRMAVNYAIFKNKPVLDDELNRLKDAYDEQWSTVEALWTMCFDLFVFKGKLKIKQKVKPCCHLLLN